VQHQFTLTLTNRWKATGLVVGGIALLGLVVAAVIGGLGRYSPAAAGLCSAGLLAGWVFWLMPWAAQRYCAETAEAVLDEKGLTVAYPATGIVQHLAYADMASYSFAYNEDCTVRPHHGPALHLHLNHKLHPQGLGPLLAFQQQFQRAVASHQLRHPEQLPIRELGFLLRPVGTVLLVLFGAFVSWLGWRAWQQPMGSESTWGGFLLLALLFAIYALAWAHERRKQRQ
jgi:hypothetical protein